MIIDLTLNPVKLPGLENYTPPFGTKKSTNVGLTTLEGCNNITLPWEHQRPVVISDNSTFSADIERNGLIEIEAADITLTMVAATFTGCEVKIMTTFLNGLATVQIGATIHNLHPASLYTLIYDGTTWSVEKTHKSNITAKNVTVAVEDFETDSIYPDYRYKAAIALAGVNDNYSPDVRFSLADAASGIFAPVADTTTDAIYIYASKVPANSVTIPVIICTPLV
ncbi:MAG: hypothetical protein MJ196_06065 [Treponemataceae bacterium]|nr:hypothetical protein [Treponemataceae bacterium]